MKGGTGKQPFFYWLVRKGRVFLVPFLIMGILDYSVILNIDTFLNHSYTTVVLLSLSVLLISHVGILYHMITSFQKR